MPIYTYRCENCGVQFERHQGFNDQPLTRCPECCKKTLRKVYQPVGIVFKGSGFYATDHRTPFGSGRSTSKDKTVDSESKTTTKSESSNSASSETASTPTPSKDD